MITVIVPVYNEEEHLNFCINSLVNQSFKDMEIILINDGSEDKSGEICERYKAKEYRVNVIHTNNQGPSAARNLGLDQAKGEFILFIDADDRISKDALEVLANCYKRSRADLTIGNSTSLNCKKAGTYNKQDLIDYTRNYLKNPSKFTLFAYSWGRLFKSEIIKSNNLRFNEKLRTFEDVAFNFDYLTHSNNAYVTNTLIYSHSVSNYRSATMSISKDINRVFGYMVALDHIERFLSSCGVKDGVSRELSHARSYLTITQLVRICGQINSLSKKRVYNFVSKLVSESRVRRDLRCYSPSSGNSRIIPMLIRLKLVWLLIQVCRYKAYKRYGRLS